MEILLDLLLFYMDLMDDKDQNNIDKNYFDITDLYKY
jgi:hypothetical protein